MVRQGRCRWTPFQSPSWVRTEVSWVLTFLLWLSSQASLVSSPQLKPQFLSPGEAVVAALEAVVFEAGGAAAEKWLWSAGGGLAAASAGGEGVGVGR